MKAAAGALFTAPLALTAGDDAPAVWLLVARAGFLLALAGGARMSPREAAPGRLL